MAKIVHLGCSHSELGKRGFLCIAFLIVLLAIGVDVGQKSAASAHHVAAQQLPSIRFVSQTFKFLRGGSAVDYRNAGVARPVDHCRRTETIASKKPGGIRYYLDSDPGFSGRQVFIQLTVMPTAELAAQLVGHVRRQYQECDGRHLQRDGGAPPVKYIYQSMEARLSVPYLTERLLIRGSRSDVNEFFAISSRGRRVFKIAMYEQPGSREAHSKIISLLRSIIQS